MQFHGVGLNIFGTGVLITGASNAGKSELGLELISRGHKFIADDAIEVVYMNQQHMIHNQDGQFILHIRDIGFIDIVRTYGNSSTLASCPLNLVIRLSSELRHEAIEQPTREVMLAEHSLKEYSLGIGNNRPLAVLSETIVKYHQQLAHGLDSHREFINRQTLLLQGVHACNLS